MTDIPEIEVIRPDWPASANVHAFTTTRSSGFSDGVWSSLNLGLHCGDNPQHVEKNRRLLSGLLPSEPRWINQVHGRRAVSWESAKDTETGADAIFSNQTGQVCAVLTADCLPVLFCNRSGTCVAVAHAGWRGLAAGVLEATVLAMDCSPSDLMAWLGPAIGPTTFEVGKDVYDSFVGSNDEDAIAFTEHGDRWLADLYQLARLALNRAGVEQVTGGQYCTYSDSKRFYSFRRDGVTGRMASIIWLE
ncbi:MAG: peptidoglycan editing factor PgeF [Xanthomonadales bacterium]|nr:peptidoglycan editing factor PgeF [Xanthomonadales bacterium]